MRLDEVTAVIITRGDLEHLMDERRAQFERLGMPCITIKAGDVFERYMAAERFVKTKVVFFQDDDVALTDEEIVTIIGRYKPGVLVCNMYDEWIEAMHYEDLAMVGLGAVCDVGLWIPAFQRWMEAYGELPDEGRLRFDCDFIFGVLTRYECYDFCGARISEAITPEASNENRLWRQPGQHERKYKTIEMARALRTVTGAVMTKNEADRIERAIESVAPLVTSIVLMDTGSTDDTISVAQKACDRLGLDFFLYHYEQVDTYDPRPPFRFDWARNQLIRFARNHGDYFLMFDADEEWIGDKELPPLQLDAMIVNYAGPLIIAHPRIIRSNFVCRFEGKVHAALVWDGMGRGITLENLSIVHHGDIGHGGDLADRLKKDIALLTEEIEDEHDVPHNLFMRAKAYEGLGEWEKARADFEARLAFPDEELEGTPAEQRYYSMYRLGVLLVEKFGKFAEGADALMTAWLFRPQRIESIRQLAIYLNAVADATPVPEHDMLFVHRDMYSSNPKEG